MESFYKPLWIRSRDFFCSKLVRTPQQLTAEQDACTRCMLTQEWAEGTKQEKGPFFFVFFLSDCAGKSLVVFVSPFAGENTLSCFRIFPFRSVWVLIPGVDGEWHSLEMNWKVEADRNDDDGGLQKPNSAQDIVRKQRGIVELKRTRSWLWLSMQKLIWKGEEKDEIRENSQLNRRHRFSPHSGSQCVSAFVWIWDPEPGRWQRI